MRTSIQNHDLVKQLSISGAEIQDKVKEIYPEILKVYEARKKLGDGSHLDPKLGVVNRQGELHASAAVKYVRWPEKHITKNFKYVYEMQILPRH